MFIYSCEMQKTCLVLPWVVQGAYEGTMAAHRVTRDGHLLGVGREMGAD